MNASDCCQQGQEAFMVALLKLLIGESRISMNRYRMGHPPDVGWASQLYTGISETKTQHRVIRILAMSGQSHDSITAATTDRHLHCRGTKNLQKLSSPTGGKCPGKIAYMQSCVALVSAAVKCPTSSDTFMMFYVALPRRSA